MRTNTFEGGTSGVTLTNLNTGGISGNAIDGTVIGSGGILEFSNAAAAHGTLSCRSATGASSVSAYAFYTLASVTSDVQRWYIHPDTLPPVERALFSYRSGANQAARISINSTGQINIRNAANTTLGNSTVTIAAGTWARLEWDIDFSTTVGAIVLRIYTSMDSTVVAETMSFSSVVFTAAADQFRYGVPGSASLAVSVHMDDAAIEGTTWFGPAAVPGTVTHAWVGAPTDEGFRVRALTAACSSVELVVATDLAMTAVVDTFGPVAPDGNGYVDLTATGLDPAVRYYWQLADVSQPVGSVGRSWTLPTAGVAASFAFAFGGCTLNNSVRREAFDDIRTVFNPLFLLHLGDFHYRDPTSTLESVHRGHWQTQIVGAAGLAELLREVPTLYLRSDHDAGPGDNADSNVASNQASINAYQQVVPHLPLGDVGGTKSALYYSFVVGRVRIIVVDVRSMARTAGLGTDGPGKTALGATQRAWLLAELDQTEPLKIIATDPGWIGAASTSDGEDKWWSYAYERQLIADHIQANDINAIVLHSDSHSLGRATPAANPYGAFAVYCAAPFGNIGGGRNLTAFTAVYNTGADVQGSQYGRVSVVDDGVSIAVTYVGYDALNGIERLTQTDVFSAAPASTEAQYIGSGEVLNGATTSIVVPRSGLTEAGDQMIAVICHLKTSTPETTITVVPTGWALVDQVVDGNGLRVAVYRKQAAGGEPASYTWNLSSAYKNWAWLGTYRGLNALTPVSDHQVDDGDSGTAHTTPAVTGAAGDWLLTIAGTRHAATGLVTTWSSDAGGDIKRAELASNGGSQDITGVVFDSAGPAGEGTQSRVLTASQSESLVGLVSLLLRPSVTIESTAKIETPSGVPAAIA